MEEIKKAYNREKQLNLNKEIIDEIKKKLLKILNDRKMMNKRGINFNIKDYKNIMKDKKENKTQEKK